MEAVIKGMKSLKLSPLKESPPKTSSPTVISGEQEKLPFFQLREKEDKLLTVCQSSYSLIVYLLMSFIAQAKLIQKAPSLPRLPTPAVLAQKLTFPPKYASLVPLVSVPCSPS